jgi:ABC-2 type transport system permease protein
MSKVKVILEKEFWNYLGNKDTFYSLVFPVISLISVLVFLILTNSQYITPQSRALAYNQILSNPRLFGISRRSLNTLGDTAITIATMIVQIPMVIQVFAFFTTYNIILTSFAFEKINKTMEVLFATPVEESDIVLGKMIASIIAGLITTFSAILVNLGAIQYIFVTSLGKLWTPTIGYIFLSIILPISMLLFALPFGLFISMKARSINQMKFGGFVGLIPFLLFVLAMKVPPQQFFTIVQLLGSTGFVISLILALLSRRFINRLAFIAN